MSGRKRKVYILNHGVFNLFGYKNYSIPGIVELTEEQLRWIEAQGYIYNELEKSNLGVGTRHMTTVAINEIRNKHSLGFDHKPYITDGLARREADRAKLEASLQETKPQFNAEMSKLIDDFEKPNTDALERANKMKKKKTDFLNELKKEEEGANQ